MAVRALSNKRIDVLLWILLQVTAILSLYSSTGVILLALLIIVTIIFRLKDTNAKSDILILALVCYLPFYTLFRLALVGEEVGIIASVFNYLRDLLIIVFFIISIFKYGLKLQKKDSVWVLFIMTWLMGFVISVIYGNTSIGIAGLHLSVIPMLLFLIIVREKTNNNYLFFLNNLYIISIIIAITGLVAYVLRPPYFSYLFNLSGNVIDAERYVRFVSIFFTPNVCGCFLCVGMCIGLSKLLIEKKSIHFFISVFLLFCTLLTLSRGAWFFAFSVVVISLVILNPKLGLLVLIIGVIVFVVARLSSFNVLNLFGSSMERIVKDRFMSIIDSSNTSSYGRVGYWLEAFELVKRSPAGYGIGVCSTAQVGRINETSLLVIDGYYAKTIVENGIIGIIYCIALVGWTVKRTVHNVLYRKDILSYSALLICIGMLIQGIGSNTLDFVCVAPWFWIVIGLVSKNQNNSIESKVA